MKKLKIITCLLITLLVLASCVDDKKDPINSDSISQLFHLSEKTPEHSSLYYLPIERDHRYITLDPEVITNLKIGSKLILYGFDGNNKTVDITSIEYPLMRGLPASILYHYSTGEYLHHVPETNYITTYYKINDVEYFMETDNYYGILTDDSFGRVFTEPPTPDGVSVDSPYYIKFSTYD